MLAEQVLLYCKKLELALQQDDLELLLPLSRECDRLLRTELPRARASGEDLTLLVANLVKLSALYRKAMEKAEAAKHELQDQLQGLTRNKASTNAYLDIASHLSR